jgi:hypothetical protein
MSSDDELARHYGRLTDDALREALSVGSGGYRPCAWQSLVRVAEARGLALDRAPVEPPVREDVASDARPWLTRLRGKPPWIAQRIAIGAVAIPFLVLCIDALRGGQWFGEAGWGWLWVTGIAATLLALNLGPTIGEMREWEATKRRNWKE